MWTQCTGLIVLLPMCILQRRRGFAEWFEPFTLFICLLCVIVRFIPMWAVPRRGQWALRLKGRRMTMT